MRKNGLLFVLVLTFVSCSEDKIDSGQEVQGGANYREISELEELYL